ncbi:hypothetical protein LTR85_010827 [Meristemomyces frigidus]|nr:hypothetical protein LTR85_010827 [Meristemomyces frigidus]
MASPVAFNQAAWQQAAFDKSFVVGPGPDQTHPADDEVVIKVAYVAINPSEWKFQEWAYLPVEYPHIIGSDAAGEVVLTGSKVTRFEPGDRVIGHCLGLVYGGARHGAFQLYTTVRERLTAKLPPAIPFSKGVVLPLALSTATAGLFEILKLRLPTTPPTPSTGEIVLIWGGSSSVGTVASQLARAAGYDVVTTASQRNHTYAKEMGAIEVFDYADPEVIPKLKEYLSGTKFAGALDCIGDSGAPDACAEIVKSLLGGGVVPTMLWPPKDLPEGVEGVLGRCSAVRGGRFDGHQADPVVVYASNPGTEDNYIAADVWERFVPAALASGVLQTKPEPQVLTGGLEKLQEALALQKRGVSARKIVMEIDASMGP